MNSIDLGGLLGLNDLGRYLDQVNNMLLDQIKLAEPSIKKAANRILLHGGKRLRPVLVIASAMCQGDKANENIIKLAAAVELIHIASLIHDDIIDKSDKRWGIPTINNFEGIELAILVGDYILAAGLRLSSEVNQQITQILADTYADMCNGQSREAGQKFNLQRSTRSYLTTTDEKTARLTSTSCQIGAIENHFSKTKIISLGSYGHFFGLSFQLIDDLLDLLSTEDQIGKPVGNDIKEGQYTLPVILSLKNKPNDNLVSLLNKTPVTVSNFKSIVSILEKDGSLLKTIKLVKRNNRLAGTSLTDFKKTIIVNGLVSLPKTYTDWALAIQSVL